MAEEAFGSYAQTIYRYARRRCSSDEVAADVLQDVFVDLIRALPRLDLSKPLLPWLLLVARRRAFDATAAIGRTCALESMREAESREVRDEPSPYEALPTPLLSDLASSDREIIYRRVFLEESFAEIGETMGLGAGACRMRYSRVCARLRALTCLQLVVWAATAAF